MLDGQYKKLGDGERSLGETQGGAVRSTWCGEGGRSRWKEVIRQSVKEGPGGRVDRDQTGDMWG